MTILQLRERLIEIRALKGDPEAAHAEAEEALLKYVEFQVGGTAGGQIRLIFDEISSWA